MQTKPKQAISSNNIIHYDLKYCIEQHTDNIITLTKAISCSDA